MQNQSFRSHTGGGIARIEPFYARSCIDCSESEEYEDEDSDNGYEDGDYEYEDGDGGFENYDGEDEECDDERDEDGYNEEYEEYEDKSLKDQRRDKSMRPLKGREEKTKEARHSNERLFE